MENDAVARWRHRYLQEIKQYREENKAIFLKNYKNASADYQSGEVFEKWFTGNLIRKITKGSVIVFDNASYHSVLVDKVPNKGSKKAKFNNILKTYIQKKDYWKLFAQKFMEKNTKSTRLRLSMI